MNNNLFDVIWIDAISIYTYLKIIMYARSQTSNRIWCCLIGYQKKWGSCSVIGRLLLKETGNVPNHPTLRIYI